jgi:hypothetical protein
LPFFFFGGGGGGTTFFFVKGAVAVVEVAVVEEGALGLVIENTSPNPP